MRSFGPDPAGLFASYSRSPSRLRVGQVCEGWRPARLRGGPDPEVVRPQRVGTGGMIGGRDCWLQPARWCARMRFGDRGDAMVVWCLLLAVLLLPLGGLSVDLWHGIAVQRQLQAAAEDAAAAGASGIDVAAYRQTGCVVLDSSKALALAQQDLADQAGLGQLAGTDIVVAPNGSEITVVLHEDVRLTLLMLVEGNRPLVVTATATSEPRGSISGDGCPAATGEEGP
jgi:Flp pilus assembly protein TadG